MSNFRYVASQYYPNVDQSSPRAAASVPEPMTPVQNRNLSMESSRFPYSSTPSAMSPVSTIHISPMTPITPRRVAAPPSPTPPVQYSPAPPVQYSKEPVISSYVGEDVPAVYSMKYRMQQSPVVQNVAAPVASVAPVAAAVPAYIPQDYFISQRSSLPSPIGDHNELEVEQVVKPNYFVGSVTNSVASPARTTKAYAPLEDNSYYEFEKNDEKKYNAQQSPIVANPTSPSTVLPSVQVPVNNYYVDPDESTYVGFKNDVTAAYGRRLIPPSYETVVSSPVSMQKFPSNVRMEPSTVCETAVEPEASQQSSRFQPSIQLHSEFTAIEGETTAATAAEISENSGVIGAAFEPADGISPVSYYHFDNLNDLVSCVKATLH